MCDSLTQFGTSLEFLLNIDLLYGWIAKKEANENDGGHLISNQQSNQNIFWCIACRVRDRKRREIEKKNGLPSIHSQYETKQYATATLLRYTV